MKYLLTLMALLALNGHAIAFSDESAIGVKLTRQAQDALVEGTVKDDGGLFLPGVTVAIQDANGDVDHVFTNGMGKFSIIVTPGTYNITFSIPGHNEIVRSEVAVVAGASVTFDIEMTRLGATVTSEADPKEAKLLKYIEEGNLAGVKTLLASGVNPNAPTLSSITSPVLAATSIWSEEHAGGPGLDIMAALLVAGADPNPYAPEYGCTIIMGMFENGSFDRINEMVSAAILLIKWGHNPDAQAKHLGNFSILMVAAMMAYKSDQHPESIMLSLELAQAALMAKANPNLRDEAGQTALMHAAIRGHLKLVQLLVANGVNLHIADENGMTALAYAKAEGKANIVNYLEGVD